MQNFSRWFFLFFQSKMFLKKPSVLRGTESSRSVISSLIEKYLKRLPVINQFIYDNTQNLTQRMIKLIRDENKSKEQSR